MAPALAILVLVIVGAVGSWTGAHVAVARWSPVWFATALAPPLLAGIATGAWLFRDQFWPSAGTAPVCRPGTECFGYAMFLEALLLGLLLLVWGIGFWRGRRSRQRPGGG